MALSEEQRQKWDAYIVWLGVVAEMQGVADPESNAAQAVDEHMRMLEGEVERLRAECKWWEVLDMMR